jgi:Trk K+ transport system NAD-binding subunit
LKQSGLGHDLDLTVLQVTREGGQLPVPDADFRFQEWDVLLVEGHRDEILKIKDIQGIDIEADIEVSDPELQSEHVGLVEAVLLPRSPWIGRTLEGIDFRDRYGIQVLGINRGGEPLHEKNQSDTAAYRRSIAHSRASKTNRPIE